MVRCRCCKEIGHKIENCSRDPNIKTVNKKLLDEEAQRVKKMEHKEYKRFFAETKVTTTHLLKACTTVPMIYPDSNTIGLGIVEKRKQMNKNEELVKQYEHQLFHRGIMKFDDVNYEAYNDNILKVDPAEQEDEPDAGVSIISKKPDLAPIDNQSNHLSQKQLDQMNAEEFVHNETNILTPEETDKIQKAKQFEIYKKQKAEKDKERAALEKKKKSKKEQDDGKEPNTPTEDNGEQSDEPD